MPLQNAFSSRRYTERIFVKIQVSNFQDKHTTEYYSAIKKTEIMPCAATWMQQEMIILNEVSQIKTNTISFICGIYKIGHR